jgi:uncharacterized protein (TIGR02145 family)
MKSLCGMLLISVIVIAAGCKKDPDEIILGGGNGTFTDARDGHVYGYVQIGDQVWMSENLAYLPNVNTPETEDERYFVYDYLGTSVTEAKATDNYKTYGVLYSYFAARYGCCPDGWHLPTEDECNQLFYLLGSAAASQLKATTGWAEETNALNTTGFSATPAGYYGGEEFNGLTYITTYWNYDSDCLYGIPNWRLVGGADYVYQSLESRYNANSTGYSVRCIRNNP